MTKNGVSYKELYQFVDDRTKEILDKFDGLESRVSKLESFKAQLLVGVSLAMTLITFWGDQIKKKLGWI